MEDQVKIAKEEADWKDIAESLGDENNKMRATVIPVVSQNFNTDDIKGNYEWVSIYAGFQSYAVFQHSTHSYCL